MAKMNWHVYSYRFTGDDLMIFTDGFRWIAYDSFGCAAINDLSDAALRLSFNDVKYSFGAFDSMYSYAQSSYTIPCGVDFADEFRKDKLSYIGLVCEGRDY